jgi:benzodiazapine receptor
MCPSRDDGLMAWRIAAAATAVIVVVIYATFSGRWVATDSGWYRSLEQPWWQPPPVVFGLIWPYNFLVLIIVGVVLALQASPITVASFLAIIAISVGFALLWAYQFYVPHALTSAALALSIAALITLPAVAIAFQHRWWLGALLVPYQIWLFLAASLSWGYASRGG